MLSEEFFRRVQAVFDPYDVRSGTENVSPLLYYLVRMQRPRVVVEYGSGYSTLFLLQALRDNATQVARERAALAQKSTDPRLRSTRDWLAAGGVACAVDPEFYLSPYEPRLYSFEDLPNTHEYTSSLRDCAEDLGLDDLLCYLTGGPFDSGRLSHDLTVDLAWNDRRDYERFFESVWPMLDPRGGLLVFHNTPGSRGWWNSVQRMIECKKTELEAITLHEFHKLNQNGLTMLRRTVRCTSMFPLERPPEIARNLALFLSAHHRTESQETRRPK